MTGTTARDYLTDKANIDLLQRHAKLTHPCYIVALCCGMDNLIVRQFDNKSDAEAFCAANPPYPTTHGGFDLNCDDVKRAYRVYSVDVGHLLGYEIITLVEGTPRERRMMLWGDEGCPWTPAAGWTVAADCIVPTPVTNPGTRRWSGEGKSIQNIPRPTHEADDHSDSAPVG